MASQVFTLDRHEAGKSVYFRLFNDSGQVFDFNDNTFKALAGATTPYVVATERGDMDGAGLSGYQATINLANVNKTPTAKHYTLKAYANPAPADADVSIADALDVIVQLGELGEGELIVQAEVSVKSTAGLTAQVKAWLERNGRKIDVDTLDAATSASVTLREHGSAIDLFSKALAAADLKEDIFEGEQATPGFTDDRQFDVEATITVNGVAVTTHHSAVVIG
ncbi:MAG: hypothetical protein KY476_00650 [Planctomycetes bacterium]|nr:hypothetical protein [Planctomycetota bacterium]